MKINAKTILTCGACILMLNCAGDKLYTLANEKEVYTNQTILETVSGSTKSYIDTKHKSADGQFISEIGTFFEIPKYQNEEKIKNILCADSSLALITKENVNELQKICLDSVYKYDEVFIRIDDNYCIKYNPFSNKMVYGTIDDNYNVTNIKDYIVAK